MTKDIPVSFDMLLNALKTFNFTPELRKVIVNPCWNANNKSSKPSAKEMIFDFFPLGCIYFDGK